MIKPMRIFMLILLVSLTLTACSGSKADAPAAVVEAFWQAMAAKDSAQLSSLSCADYESTALTTLDSFQSVDLELKDIQCTSSSITEENAEVTCKGSLNASYGAEDFSFDLSASTYLVVNQGGNWLMCGEK